MCVLTPPPPSTVPLPLPPFSENLQGPARGSVILEGGHRDILPTCHRCPGHTVPRKGDPLTLLLFRPGLIPRPEGRPWHLRGRWLLLGRQVPSVNTLPPPVGSPAAPRDGARPVGGRGLTLACWQHFLLIIEFCPDARLQSDLPSLKTGFWINMCVNMGEGDRQGEIGV